MILTSKSFDIIRGLLGKLSSSQVRGLEYIVGQCKAYGLNYPQCAYVLATVHIECDKTFQPIVEYGSVKYFDKYDTGILAKQLGNTPALDGDGYKYRGRGYVQITGEDNYKRIGKLIGIDLLGKPDLALEPEIAAAIMCQGMSLGWFTGLGFWRKRDVHKYDLQSYTKARAIINGTNRAKEIADLAMVYEKALRS